MNKSLTKKSRYLSMLLRHKPEKANLTMNSKGWVMVNQLLANTDIDMPLLKEVVATNNKKRFEFNDDNTMIRASQGHSLKVDLGYPAKEPPEYLYHGTATKFLDAIHKDGLKPMSRHHVHLSTDKETAKNVGSRHGKAVILLVKSQEMFNSGKIFFISTNGVWLTESVAPEFLTVWNK